MSSSAPRYFVVPAPGTYGDVTNVLWSSKKLEDAKGMCPRGYVVRAGDKKAGSKWYPAFEAEHPVVWEPASRGGTHSTIKKHFFFIPQTGEISEHRPRSNYHAYKIPTEKRAFIEGWIEAASPSSHGLEYPSGFLRTLDVLEKGSSGGKSHATIGVPQPNMTVREINAIVRAAKGRNVYLIRTRLGDQTVQRVTQARTRGREMEVRSLATGNWLPVLPELGDTIEVR